MYKRINIIPLIVVAFFQYPLFSQSFIERIDLDVGGNVTTRTSILGSKGDTEINSDLGARIGINAVFWKRERLAARLGLSYETSALKMSYTLILPQDIINGTKTEIRQIAEKKYVNTELGMDYLLFNKGSSDLSVGLGLKLGRAVRNLKTNSITGASADDPSIVGFVANDSRGYSFQMGLQSSYVRWFKNLGIKLQVQCYRPFNSESVEFLSFYDFKFNRIIICASTGIVLPLN